MPISVDVTAPGHALDALADAIHRAKAGRPLSPVTVIVPTNTAGVMARRALGRLGGIAAVDMLTLYRLAELIGSPALVADGRSPVSTAVVDLAIRRVLAEAPGSYGPVAEHPSTGVALRDLHRELRLAGPDAVAALTASSPRGREAARVSQLTTRRLRADWYDEGDLLEHAELATQHAVPQRLAHTIVYLPQQLRGRELRLLRGLGRAADVHVILGLTGDAGADAELSAIAATLDPGRSPPERPTDARSRPQAAVVDVVSTTDADDEVRLAVRAVLDAARTGTPFARMAILWAAEKPYARLVEHHLDGAEIEWNGRPGTRVTERLVPRLVLDLLDVDRRGLRRRNLFDLLADVPARGHDGHRLHTAAWERASRAAGVARDDHWATRLGAYAAREQQRAEATEHEGPVRNAADAVELAAFVTDLRATLGPPTATRSWLYWADWCDEQIERWVGRSSLQRLSDPERSAWEAVERVLDRLRHLDAIGPPVRRREFRATFLAELEVAPPRQGRVGNGVTTGALAGAAGLDVDLVVVVGAADGLLPPPPSPDPLISDADRHAATLTTSGAMAERVHRQFLSVLSVADRVVVTYPRGDLRATAHRVPSRWLDAHVPLARRLDVASHGAGLSATEFPVSHSEHRLRGLWTHVASGAALVDAQGAATDPVLRRAVAMRAARRSPELTVYDGDLTGVAVPRLDRPVSPTELETWIACPHKYFVRYLLRVYEVEEPGDEISITALDKGSALHIALDRFNQAVLAGELPQPDIAGWTDRHVTALANIFDTVGVDTERAGRTGRPAFWADERDRMRADVLGWIAHDDAWVRDRRVRLLSSERAFGAAGDVTISLPSGRSLALKGSVDRIDVADDGSYVVTDHKTGSARSYRAISDSDPTASGTRLQLAAYAAATLALAGRPDATVRAEYSFFASGEYKRVGYTFTPAVWAEVAVWFEHVVDGIESGLYPATPERPTWSAFTRCIYCDPDKLGTAERWGEWDRKRHDARLQRWFADPDTDPNADPDS
ncbi:MAG TPA: PD-(D/E)XK nuclease family protein, partial [Ilumatobacteraceae bacterium]|nr:PD-(D/E)XK nuclease family protein [Ilumatobacteraceae bacterium]